MGLEDLKKSFDGAITAAANAASDATSIAKKSIQSIDISDAKKVQERPPPPCRAPKIRLPTSPRTRGLQFLIW